MDALPVNPKEVALPIRAKIEIEGVVQGITVKPGETLVLSFRQRLSMQDVDGITTRLKALIPNTRIVVLDNDVKLTVLPQDTDDMRDMISEMIIDHFRDLANKDMNK
jgi:hypothetical protein